MDKWLNGSIVEMTFEEEGRQKNRASAPLPKEIQIQDFKQKLLDTDYIANKIIEGDATIEDYKETIELRKDWRRQIRALENMK